MAALGRGETIALGREGRFGMAAVYLALTGVLCLGGAWLGRAVAVQALGG